MRSSRSGTTASGWTRERSHARSIRSLRASRTRAPRASASPSSTERWLPTTEASPCTVLPNAGRRSCCFFRGVWMAELNPLHPRSITQSAMESTTARILLVDDEPSQFSYTTDLLERLRPRYALEWSQNYESGLYRIMRGDVDAALVDYRLGARSGLDLAREAMARECDVPLVILTAQGDESVDFQAMLIGVADYLDKTDLTPELLDRTLRYAMRHQESLRLLRRAE